MLGEAFVKRTDGGFEVGIHDADDDIDLVRALFDHADVDADLTEGREDHARNAEIGCHTATDDGNEADTVAYLDGIGIKLLFDIGDQRVQTVGKLFR